MTNKDKLEEYIDLCIDNNLHKKIKNKVDYHHILPKSLFRQYSNLNENLWNGSYLSYEFHYKAHSLLSVSIDSFPTNFAFQKNVRKNYKIRYRYTNTKVFSDDKRKNCKRKRIK